MEHDCTKCYKPVRKDDLVEFFGVIYHVTCAPKRRVKKSLKKV